MAGLRLVLILLLSVAGDLVVPPLPEAMDSVGESEEALHRTRGRRPLPLIRELSVPSMVRPAQASPVLARTRASGESARTTRAGSTARRSPPPVPDSASPADDH
jgi:hypothetical protein